ncbi:MAG TPA: antitoxin [Bryobacteraceae bacterium]|jgi:antitoxin ChpS|nr:antitoxin [Bryobacteraceae bacterium]
MPSVTLRKSGGAVVMAVPRKILELVQLEVGSKVDLTVENGRVVISPERRPRYTLTELLSKCRPGDLAPHKRDREWLRDPPRGKEIL